MSAIFHSDNTIPTGDWIWVFGSNLRGAHGKGAAKVARTNFRAEYGVGEGPTGRAYAIPTKGRNLEKLPLQSVKESIAAFLKHARENPKANFFVTAVGTQLAGFTDEEIGPLFAHAPSNCSLPAQWKVHVEQGQAQGLLVATGEAA